MCIGTIFIVSLMSVGLGWYMLRQVEHDQNKKLDLAIQKTKFSNKPQEIHAFWMVLTGLTMSVRSN